VSVSKGSINRVNKIKKSFQGSESTEQMRPDIVEIKITEEPRDNVKGKATKKVNEIQVEKYRVISKIKQDIPDYLL
jgi:hypothetical protein